jgi:hypothetical protein
MPLSGQAGMLKGGNKGRRQQRICRRVGVNESVGPFIAEAAHAAVQAVQGLGHALSG